MVNVPLLLLIVFAFACAGATIVSPWLRDPLGQRFFWPLWPSVVVIAVDIGALFLLFNGQKLRGPELMWWGIVASFALAPIAWWLHTRARRAADALEARRSSALGYAMWVIAAMPHLWHDARNLTFAFLPLP
jgi:CDP-diglyceride synthetase